MNEMSSIAEMAPDTAETVPHAGLGFLAFVCMIAALMAMNALAIDTMLPALPQIGDALGIHAENTRQWIVTTFLLGFGVAQIVYGPVSDRFGRRPMLLGGMAGYALASLGAALSTSFAMLLVFRALQGVAVASTRVVTVSVVRDCYGGRQMARVMSLAFMTFLAVPVLAPSIGQIIMLFVPWRGLFAALAIYALIVFAWVAARLPETLHPRFRRRINVASLWDGVRTTFGSRQACGYMLAQTAMTAALFGFVNSVQQIFADTFHAAALMPAVFAAVAGMMAVASFLNSRIVERLGTRRVSHSALLGFVGFELIHLAIAASGHETIWTFAVCQGCTMFCFGLAVGNFGSMAMEPLAAVAGTAASLQGFVSTVFGALGGFAIGQSYDGTTIPMTLGFAGFGALALLIVLLTERGKLFRPQMGS